MKAVTAARYATKWWPLIFDKNRPATCAANQEGDDEHPAQKVDEEQASQEPLQQREGKWPETLHLSEFINVPARDAPHRAEKQSGG